MNYVLSCFFMGFSYCGIIFSCEADTEISEYILLIGNPGAGKSTLLNSLVYEHVAESGISPGTGLTTKSQKYQYQGRAYIDTPGLSDTKIRTEATKEIENALKMNGKYRIFFVLNLSAGRIRPDDINTINSVMDAISDDKSFNVIINNVNRKEVQEIFNDPIQRKILLEQINSGRNKTQSFYYIERCQNIEDGLTEFLVIDDKLNQFIYHESSSFFLDAKNVSEIKDLEKLKEELKIKLEQEKAEAQKKLEEQQKKEKALQEELRRQQEALEKMNYCYYINPVQFSCISKQAYY